MVQGTGSSTEATHERMSSTSMIVYEWLSSGLEAKTHAPPMKAISPSTMRNIDDASRRTFEAAAVRATCEKRSSNEEGVNGRPSNLS